MDKADQQADNADRQVHGHEINEANAALTIFADGPGPGGASHEYRVRKYSKDGPLMAGLTFQNGPIMEAGVNGVTNEVLLVVVIDRLTGFQAGAWACPENQDAKSHIEAALQILHRRTQLRDERGVEGTSRL